MKRVTFYTKPGCHLCDVARSVVLEVQMKMCFHLEVVNIRQDAAAREKYKNDVPVILVDDIEIARHRLSQDVLEQALADPSFTTSAASRIVAARSPVADVTLVIMAKVPAAGRVKTRLTPALSPEQAASVHTVFLVHLARRLLRLAPGELVVCYDPPGAAEAMKRVVQQVCPAAVYLAQSDGDLGNRLACATDGLRDGMSPTPNVLFLGVDSPDVPTTSILQACEMLQRADVIVGPTADGGYWCLGLSSRVDARSLLQDIAWSSGQERSETIVRARSMGYVVAQADDWVDVDYIHDLHGLVVRLMGSADPEDRILLNELLKSLPEGLLS